MAKGAEQIEVIDPEQLLEEIAETEQEIQNEVKEDK